MLTGYAPAFTTWQGELYESELIRAVVDAKARHISKLNVEIRGSAGGRLRAATKAGPNPWMTWSQFLYRVSTIWDVNNTACIVPILDEYGETKGFFPVLPTQCEIVADEKDTPYLRYSFSNGKKAAIELSRCAVLRKHQYQSDIFGSSNHALDDTLSLIHMQRQGIMEGIKNGATFRWLAQTSNLLKDTDITKARKQFNEQNLQGESGGILIYNKNLENFRQIESKPYVVDAEQTKLIQNNVFNYFGCSEKVLQNTAIGAELDAFFDGAIEPFMIQFDECMTNMTFTPREVAQGNFFVASANRLQYMSTNDKIKLVETLGDRGYISIDEGRALLNYPPLGGEAGAFVPIRGEYYNRLTAGKEDDNGTDGKTDS